MLIIDLQFLLGAIFGVVMVFIFTNMQRSIQGAARIFPGGCGGMLALLALLGIALVVSGLLRFHF